MKILVVTQYYWPEPFNYSEICETLQARGHEVCVLTGRPNYPEGEIYPGYECREVVCERHNDVDVIRVANKPRKHGALHRFINYYDFPYQADKVIGELDCDYDVVLGLISSPVMTAKTGIKIAEKFDIPFVCYVIDLWPEALTSGGIREGSLVYNHYKKVSRNIYNRSDLLLVTSPSFEQYLTDLLGHKAHSYYLPQFAEDLFASEEGNAIRPDGFDPEKFNLTFAGNIGVAQSVDTIVKAAIHLKNDERFLFHIVGSGSELEYCKNLAKKAGLVNIVFHGRHELNEMPNFYHYSDAMLATFADMPKLGLTLPRKIQSYMAAGKPILASALGETCNVIDDAHCGYHCSPENSEGLAELCIRLADCGVEEREKLGSLGHEYYLKYFAKNSFFNNLENSLMALKGKKHNG